MTEIPAAVVVAAAHVCAELVRRCHTAGQPVPTGVLPTLNALTAAIAASGNESCPDPDDTEHWVTVAEHAAATGQPARSIRWQCANGRLPARKIGQQWQIRT